MEKNMQRQKDRRKSILLFLLLFFVLSLASVVLGIVCLDGAQEGFFRKHFYLLAIVYAALMGLSYGLCVWVTLAGKKVAQKAAISVYVLLLIALGLCYLLQKTGFFEVVNSQEKLQAYLEKTGAWMPIIYVLLQFLQVVILPIPSLVTTLVGVPLFGALGATVYSLIGILLGSATAFFIGRKFGNRAAGWLVGEETLAKWQKKLKGKDNLFLTCAFVLPFFPDDILCLIAGISTMPARYFFIVIRNLVYNINSVSVFILIIRKGAGISAFINSEGIIKSANNMGCLHIGTQIFFNKFISRHFFEIFIQKKNEHSICSQR